MKREDQHDVTIRCLLLTETKNWGGRNEATETSGRLHLLWLQNKRLHSPRTTDRLHTRQDRWIQKELARTHTKNATKPNPLEIIPLQPTRKENNEEAMERAAVTLETERVKWPNPGCLWWWLLTSVSTCFRHHYAHLQENKGPVTVFVVLFWFCWMWLVAVVGRCLVGCEH